MKTTQLDQAAGNGTAGINLGYELEKLTDMIAKAKAVASELDARLEAILCPETDEVAKPSGILSPEWAPASKHVTTVRQQQAQMEVIINLLAETIQRVQA